MKSMDGVFVQASEQEMSEIWEACASRGLPLDQKGILALIMIAVHGDPDEEEDEADDVPADPLSDVLKHFVQNPEHADALKAAGAKLFQKLFTKPK